MVEFRMLVEFEPCEFSHMTSLMRSKRRRFFTNLHIESLILVISSREFPGLGKMYPLRLVLFFWRKIEP